MAAPPTWEKKQKKWGNINLFTCFWIVLPEPPLYWFISHRLPAAKSEAVLRPVLVVAPQPRLCFPANGFTQSDRGSAVIGCWGGLFTGSHHAPRLLAWGNTWAEPAAVLEGDGRAAAPTLIARAHGEYTTDNNYRGRQKNDHREKGRWSPRLKTELPKENIDLPWLRPVFFFFWLISSFK